MKFCQSYAISEIEDVEKGSNYTTVVQFRISYTEKQNKKQNKLKDEFEDNKGVIRIRIWKKNRHHSVQKRRYKGQTTVYKTYI